MNYLEVAKNIKKLSLSNDLINTILECISLYWQGNYYRTPEETQHSVKVLEKRLTKRQNLTTDNVEHILWLLDRYGRKDDLNEIVAISKNQKEIPTIYESENE